MLCDLHTHTHHSFDGFADATAFAMAKAAVDGGLYANPLTVFPKRQHTPWRRLPWTQALACLP